MRVYETVTVSKFFNDKHIAFVVDLRTLEDNKVSGHGRKIIDTQSRILLEITKEATSKDLVCYIFVVAYGHVYLSGKILQGAKYFKKFLQTNSSDLKRAGVEKVLKNSKVKIWEVSKTV